jgi:hypothetical protein
MRPYRTDIRDLFDVLDCPLNFPGDSLSRPSGSEIRRAGRLSDAARTALCPARFEVANGSVLGGAPPAVFYGVTNRTEPKTARQWLRYIVVAAIALFLVWWMLRLFVI